MATIKAIEASSVHQIQSGQVIVDLCSVAKELVENGLDAGATSIEVRFKNQGLDSIEVQDNGSGISPDNYESVALKHYTSKLSTYSDLTTLETFGFRGEALSSLCALSQLTLTTCRETEAPRGTRLEFLASGKLNGTSVVAAQKGTTVSVEDLFKNLPVRRRELERNIKREWGKVISLLNQYACIQTGVKFTVSQTPSKGKRIVLFSTRGNKTTRDNIVNVFGAKTISALVALELNMALEATSGASQKWSSHDDSGATEILVRGFVSRPNHGEGRHTPDRQMFYVNSRPCGLPQFAKVFNEVYRSFNSSQSPFIFADVQLDTHLYDVNVSPDKRTILLHEQTRMLDNLRDSLTDLLERQDYNVPMSQIATFKQPAFRKLTVPRQNAAEGDLADTTSAAALTSSHEERGPSDASDVDADSPDLSRMKNMAAAKSLAQDAQASDLVTCWMERKLESRGGVKPAETSCVDPTTEKGPFQQVSDFTAEDVADRTTIVDEEAEAEATRTAESTELPQLLNMAPDGDDFLARLAKLKQSFLPKSLQNEVSDDDETHEAPIPAIAKISKPLDYAPLSASSARHPKRPLQEVATITIGDHTVTSLIGTPSKRLKTDALATEQRRPRKSTEQSKQAATLPSFNGRLTQMYAAAAAAEDQDSNELETLQDETKTDEDSDDADNDDAVARAEENASVGSEVQGTLSEKQLPMFVGQDVVVPILAIPQGQDDEINYRGGGDCFDEEGKKAWEDRTKQDIVREAEEAGHEPSAENQKRTQALLKGPGKGKCATQTLLQRLTIDTQTIKSSHNALENQLRDTASNRDGNATDDFETGLEADNAEECLALTIHKGDFGRMKVVGQFNLGFVLAVRPGNSSSSAYCPLVANQAQKPQDDELFIIDQHASDEKFNFERLQATTTVQSQRLVCPKFLDLTAVEEEIVIENQAALQKNGFIVAVDNSGDEPVGMRCQLLALPLSRETTFSLADLEELISLLGDTPTTTNGGNEGDGQRDGGGHVPRPSKIRKMFAMRACRSSIMIGKALSRQQMERVVRHMGEMEKPWNCPHGRPTMRHLCGLGRAWDERLWGEGTAAEDRGNDTGTENRMTMDWATYVRESK